MNRTKLSAEDPRHDCILDCVSYLLKAGKAAVALELSEQNDAAKMLLSTLPTGIMVLSKGVFASLREVYDCHLLDEMVRDTNGH